MNSILSKNFALSICLNSLLFLGLFSLSGCEEAIRDSDPISEFDAHRMDANQILQNFSFALAIVIENQSARELLQHEISKEFGGDFQVLFKDIKDQEVISGKTFGDMVFDNFPASPDCRASLPASFSEWGSLQISMPVQFQEWDNKNYVPLIAVVPVDFDDQKVNQITARGSNSAVSYLDLKNEPTLPVLVVSFSERTDKTGKLLPEYEHLSPSDTDFDDFNRISGDYEILSWLQIEDLGSVETWILGKPELDILVVGSSANGSMTTAVSKDITKKVVDDKSRNEVQNGVEVNLGLFVWKNIPNPQYPLDETYGSEIKVKIVERDDTGGDWKFTLKAGGTVKVSVLGVTVEVPTAQTGIEYTYKNGDDDCGDAIVNFNDLKPGPNPFGYYNTGVVKFKEL